MKKALRTIFICALLLVLLAGFSCTVFSPKEINAYENRYAEKVQTLTAQSFASGEFQDSLEAALGDQILFSETLKELYNNVRSYFMRSCLPILTSSGNQTQDLANPNNYDYVALDDTITRIFGPEHLCILPQELDDESKASIDKISANTNGVIARHPEIEFYAYYVEKDVDLDLRTGEKILTADYIFDSLDIPKDHTSKFVISNAANFDYYFYMTDHHWNYLGSYLGYQQIYALLGLDGPQLKPVSLDTDDAVAVSYEKNTAGFNVYNIGSFGGTRSVGTYASFKEDFKAYRYDYPEFEITQDGEPFDNYGNQESFLDGTYTGDLTYASYYGYDCGEATIKRREGSNKILVLGDSYDNALLKLLASHFDELYSIDLRYYKQHFGKDFDFDSYVAENGITKVLIIGNRELFSSDPFLIDKEAE